MDYPRAIEYLDGLALIDQKRPSAPSVERIKAFLSFDNFPQNSFTSFHIGGTNGKGSTTAILDSSLRQSKSKIGRFIGPHLLKYNERFHINGCAIENEELAFRISSLKTQSEKFSTLKAQCEPLSWFEFLVALAFRYFADNKIDVAVVEVGLGGRFDATNVLERVSCSAITNIALDHEKILGSDIEKIAMEKAGIIKSGVPIVTAATQLALDIIQQRALELRAPITVVQQQDPDHDTLAVELAKIRNEIPSRGLYQQQNALVALHMLKAANMLNCDAHGSISLEQALWGVKNFYWPGRFQILESEQIILDGAHNPAGAEALRQSLNSLFPNQSFHFVFACYADKDGPSMLNNLLRGGDTLFLPNISARRAMYSPRKLSNIARQMGIHPSEGDSITQALQKSKERCSGNCYTVVCGSFSLIKATVEALGWHCVEDGLR